MKTRKKKMEDAIVYYCNNETILLGECAKKFNVDRGTLSAHLKKMNIKTNRKINKNGEEYSDFNENFFEVIDNEEKAYWLGFILADGSIDNSRNQISIALASVDRDHLVKFQKSINNKKNIFDYLANNNVTKKRYPTSDLIIYSKKMKDDLFNLNVYNNKTKKEKPCEIPIDLIRHYIRGFFDGDGWISSYDRRIQDRCKNKKWELGFGSSFEMVDYISTHFSNTLNIKYKEPKKKCIYRIRYGSNIDIAKIINYLYKDATIYLDRKQNKILEFCRSHSKLIEECE